jgi:hypothetical protein
MNESDNRLSDHDEPGETRAKNRADPQSRADQALIAAVRKRDPEAAREALRRGASPWAQDPVAAHQARVREARGWPQKDAGLWANSALREALAEGARRIGLPSFPRARGLADPLAESGVIALMVEMAVVERPREPMAETDAAGWLMRKAAAARAGAPFAQREDAWDEASCGGLLAAAKRLWETGVCDVERRDSLGRTPLASACERGLPAWLLALAPMADAAALDTMGGSIVSIAAASLEQLEDEPRRASGELADSLEWAGATECLRLAVDLAKKTPWPADPIVKSALFGVAGMKSPQAAQFARLIAPIEAPRESEEQRAAALALAAERDSVELVEALLPHCDPLFAHPKKGAALEAAIAAGSFEAVKRLWAVSNIDAAGAAPGTEGRNWAGAFGLAMRAAMGLQKSWRGGQAADPNLDKAWAMAGWTGSRWASQERKGEDPKWPAYRIAIAQSLARQAPENRLGELRAWLESEALRQELGGRPNMAGRAASPRVAQEPGNSEPEPSAPRPRRV